MLTKIFAIDLHSNLVIFKSSRKSSNSCPFKEFTFQSGDIQIYLFFFVIIIHKTIYIPIWWYSNNSKRRKGKASKDIYIPIWWYSNFSVSVIPTTIWRIYIPIWWYSNHHIQASCSIRLYYLHSNLVIFKFTPSCVNSLPSIFTFQSGDIQILLLFRQYCT